MSDNKKWQFELEEYIRLGEPKKLKKVKHGKLRLVYNRLMD